MDDFAASADLCEAYGLDRPAASLRAFAEGRARFYLVRALQRLSPRERECVVLWHYLDLSEKDTAATLGISVGSVKSYTSKGLAGLRPLLSTTEEERYV